MELFVYVPDMSNISLTFHHEENLDAAKEVLASGVVPTEVTITNSIPDMDFTSEFSIDGHQELLTFPVIQLVKELLDDRSSLCRRLSLSGSSVDEKGAVFVDIWEKCLAEVFAKFTYRIHSMDNTMYDVFYGDPLVDKLAVMGGEARGPHFTIELPGDIVKNYYSNPVNYLGLNNIQQFFDLSKLNNEDFIKYVAPKYYVDISEDFRASLRSNAAKMAELNRSWVDTLFAALH